MDLCVLRRGDCAWSPPPTPTPLGTVEKALQAVYVGCGNPVSRSAGLFGLWASRHCLLKCFNPCAEAAAPLDAGGAGFLVCCLLALESFELIIPCLLSALAD